MYWAAVRWRPRTWTGCPARTRSSTRTLRLEPPAYVMRAKEALEDRVVGGYRIPKGTLMLVGMRVLHRRSDCWEHAGEFRPERWLEASRSGGAGVSRARLHPVRQRASQLQRVGPGHDAVRHGAGNESPSVCGSHRRRAARRSGENIGVGVDRLRVTVESLP